ncbi:putative molybdenum carrier protein [Desulfobulbus alkaliphilus]|uniref:putative molybdenum carrier protein n=1 Tax=Desulfobulbus alkaliphilus TaxID=869814 RepID=UPI001965F800|nr:putative molybdenum carrier protein [Desulfobulbus alkaliphilus]MBM9536711.1 putative molybdenum carrier protein [Desulfobulbus alkaliphilus]
MIEEIISGGQTGADRAALDAAILLDIPHGGWLPKGRKTEDGPLSRRYTLREMHSRRYRDRTEKNVMSADVTLLFSFGPLSGGSALTEALAIRHDRPYLHIDLEHFPLHQAAEAVQTWLLNRNARIVNIAGPRASSEARIYPAVFAVLMALDWVQLRAPEQSFQRKDR